jgi:anti-sigma regulatory factor (Ser/Thr protein kinase)
MGYLAEKSKETNDFSNLFRKEVYTLKNDFYYQFYENDKNRWFFDISYKPHQTLSGDSYSIRDIGEDKVFIFLIDAMGKGLDASITSIISSTFLNYLVDMQKEKNNFNLEYTIRKYLQFIQTSIFEEEIVSASFVLFDFKNNTLQSAIFGIPPILIQKKNGHLEKIKSNNLPISLYSKKVNIKEQTLLNITKLLIYSDGLNETIINDSQMYKDYMEKDFCEAYNYKDFLNKALKRVHTFDDDMTLLYIEKDQLKDSSSKSMTIKSRQEELEIAREKVEDFLISHHLSPKNEAYMNTAFMEMLLNAYEHGNLKISYDEKKTSMQEGTFDDLLREREIIFGDQTITINLHFTRTQTTDIYTIEVLDEGDGFDTKIMKNKFSKKGLYNGRGLVMTSKMVDAFYYNNIGNKVILKKFQTKDY